MAISDFVQRVKEALRQGAFTSEAAVSQGILLPALHELGWPVFDTTVVVPEFSLEGRRVDFALCHPASRPAVFVEVKKVGLSEGADRQLFEYAFHVGVPFAILTDGQEWSFYLPGEQGRYDERRVYKLDLLEREPTEASERLQRYLQYSRVCSGEALQAARSDYRDVARDREIDLTLPKAWIALLRESDSLLLELLADKVEDLCGYKPDLDSCSNFLEQSISSRVEHPTNQRRQIPQAEPAQPRTQQRGHVDRPRTRITHTFDVVFKGETHQANSAIDVLATVFTLLSNADNGFLERFTSRKHGKKRRYLASNRSDLYPGRPDLVEKHSTEIMPGWWMGTNYSTRDIQKIINLAREVTKPEFRNALKADVE